MAVGMTYMMIAGGVDLSVGAVYSRGAVVCAGLGSQVPLGVAVVAAVALGAVLGGVNGLLVSDCASTRSSPPSAPVSCSAEPLS